MFAKILGAQQPLLLRRDRSKENRACRCGLRGAPSASNFQQDAAAGAIVNRAVIDVVAALRPINAEMIVMRRVEDRFSSFVVIGSLNHSQDVPRTERPQRAHHMRLQVYRQLDRLELPRLRLLEQLVQVESRHADKLPRHLFLNPRSRLQLWRAIQLQVGPLSAHELRTTSHP